jgi:hypothetical protein
MLLIQTLKSPKKFTQRQISISHSEVDECDWGRVLKSAQIKK